MTDILMREAKTIQTEVVIIQHDFKRASVSKKGPIEKTC